MNVIVDTTSLLWSLVPNITAIQDCKLCIFPLYLLHLQEPALNLGQEHLGFFPETRLVLPLIQKILILFPLAEPQIELPAI